MRQEINDEIDLKELWIILVNYKWLIFSITIISLILGMIYLNYQQPIYSAYSILKVNDNGKKRKVEDMLLNPQSTLETVNTQEDISLLKTFYINNQALNLNRAFFKIQYYINGDEVYNYGNRDDEIPIEIDNIEILDKNILGKKITLTPTDSGDGYKLNIKYSSLEKLLRKNLLKLRDRVYKYNSEITTKYFKLKIKKMANFNYKIDFNINGDNRYIYEKIIKQNLNISQVEKEVPIIKISYKDNIRERAIAYIDSLSSSFIKESIINKTEQSKKVLTFITKELNNMKKKLKKSERALEIYRVSHKVIEPSTQASTFIRKLSEMDIELSENRLKESLIKSIKGFLKRTQNIEAVAPALMELNEKPTLQLISTLQNLELKRDKLLVELTSKHPSVIEVNNQISMLKRKIKFNIRNIEKQIYQKSSNLRKLISSYDVKLKSLPTKERKLINIKRDYEVSSNMYNFLLKKKTENEIYKVSTLSDYRVIDKAYSSPIPVSPKRGIILVIFTLIGLITAIIITYWHNAIADKIRYIEQIKNIIKFPIYATISINNKRIKYNNIYNYPSSSIAEDYRTLRTNLKLKLDKIKDSRGKVILISSTSREEDKDLVVVNLSTIFQMANYKVVAIELDLREPMLHRFFNIRGIDRDIVSYLRGDSSIEDIIYYTKYDNLQVIPAKEIASNPSELILSSNLSKLIDELKVYYDYIIINSTPFGNLADTKYLIKYSDIFLAVLRKNITQKKSILELNSLISEENIKNIGAVFINYS